MRKEEKQTTSLAKEGLYCSPSRVIGRAAVRYAVSTAKS